MSLVHHQANRSFDADAHALWVGICPATFTVIVASSPAADLPLGNRITRPQEVMVATKYQAMGASSRHPSSRFRFQINRSKTAS